MRIGVVSDIHSNPNALALMLAEVAGVVDEVWCAGDIVLEYRFCKRTIGLLREHEATAVQGNHDIVLTSAAGARARRDLAPDDDDLAWLEALPRRYERSVDGRQLLMVHGNPWSPASDYLYPHDQRWRHVDDLGVDIVLTGHTHVPMAERFGRTLVVNPGSISEPRQHHDRVGTYAVLDIERDEVEIRAIRP